MDKSIEPGEYATMPAPYITCETKTEVVNGIQVTAPKCTSNIPEEDIKLDACFGYDMNGERFEIDLPLLFERKDTSEMDCKTGMYFENDNPKKIDLCVNE